MKKLTALVLLAFLGVSCGSDDNETPGGQPPRPATEEVDSFTGDVEVTPLEASRFNAFEDPGIVFEMKRTPEMAAGEFILTMNRIKFVEQMPKRVTFEVKGLTLDDAGRFGAVRTVPYWNGEPYDPAGDGTYTIHDLTGTVEYAADGTPLHLTVAFDCYTMHVAYSGDFTHRKQ